jgi:23S rRNA pseudouridine2457 synthase
MISHYSILVDFPSLIPFSLLPYNSPMPHRCLLFHKPYGVLSSFTDPSGRETLKAYIDVPGVYSAGRLDYDSEGLLLLTDDGALIKRLTDPAHHLPKTYWVQVEGLITPEALDQLSRGVTIQGWQTLPSTARLIPEPDLPPRDKPITPHKPPCWIELTLTEGKKRQIRHMTASVGFPTLRLVRFAIGPLKLGSLQPGEWRWLKEDELAALNNATRSHLSF